MGGDAAAVQGVEGGGAAVGDIPHHAVLPGDGLAVGQGGLGGLVLAGLPVGGVGQVVEGVADGGAALAVPQHVAAVQAGGGQHGGGAAGQVDLHLPAPAAGLVHIVVVGIPVAAALARAVVAVGHDVAVTGLRQAAHRAAGGVGPCGPGKLQHVAVAAPLAVAGAGEPARARVGVVLGEHHAPGVGVAVIQGHQTAVLIHEDELVEGVAHIAVGDVHHVVIGVGDGHVALPHRHGQVGLVVEAVVAGVHLMAGAEVEVAAVLVAPQAASVEGHGGVGPPQAGLPQAVPVLVVLDHPDDLGAVALGGVGLAEDQEVVVLPGEKAAPEGQLHGHRAAGLEGEGAVIVLHHDLPAGVLHPGQAAVVPVQVRGHRLAPGGVVVLVDVAALGRPGRRRRPRHQGQHQRRRAGQGAQAPPSGCAAHTEFLLFACPPPRGRISSGSEGISPKV